MILGGFLDFFSGESGESRNQQEISQNVNTDVTGSSKQETGQKSKTTGAQQTTATTGQQQQVTSKLFSPEEEEALKGVLAGLIGTFGAQGGTVPPNFLNAAGEAVNAAGILNTRAGTAEQDIISQIQPIITERERVGQRQIGTGRTNLGTVVGSNQDSFITAATSEAQAALQSQLAALESELRIGARATQTDEMTKAITALLGGAQAGGELANLSATSGIGNIAEVAQLLRGATSTQETTGAIESSQNVESQQLTEALQEIINNFSQSTRSKTSGSSTSNTQTSQTGSLLDVLNGIGGLANP